MKILVYFQTDPDITETDSLFDKAWCRYADRLIDLLAAKGHEVRSSVEEPYRSQLIRMLDDLYAYESFVFVTSFQCRRHREVYQSPVLPIKRYFHDFDSRFLDLLPDRYRSVVLVNGDIPEYLKNRGHKFFTPDYDEEWPYDDLTSKIIGYFEGRGQEEETPPFARLPPSFASVGSDFRTCHQTQILELDLHPWVA